MIYVGISATQIFCSKIVILLVSQLKASPSCFTVSSSSRLTFIERRWSLSYSSSTSYLFQGFCHSVVKIKRSNLCLKKCLFKDVFHLWDNVFCQIIFPCKITILFLRSSPLIWSRWMNTSSFSSSSLKTFWLTFSLRNSTYSQASSQSSHSSVKENILRKLKLSRSSSL